MSYMYIIHIAPAAAAAALAVWPEHRCTRVYIYMKLTEVKYNYVLNNLPDVHCFWIRSECYSKVFFIIILNMYVYNMHDIILKTKTKTLAAAYIIYTVVTNLMNLFVSWTRKLKNTFVLIHHVNYEH